MEENSNNNAIVNENDSFPIPMKMSENPPEGKNIFKYLTTNTTMQITNNSIYIVIFSYSSINLVVSLKLM